MNNLKIFILNFAFLLLILSSCSSIKTLPNGNKIDKELVGVWEGSESDKQIEGLKKEWRMTREINGTFILNFKGTYDDETLEWVEYGNWWVDGSTFYEYHSDSEKTDIYKYTVLNDKQVRFEMLNTEIDFDETNYTFIDTKITKDGLSIENAIKVKNIAEEYEYVKNHCQNCQLLGQALIEREGKFYDELRLKKTDEKEIAYYFDLSSFFGRRYKRVF